MAPTADVAVVGAGVVGYFVAYYLARRGVRVRLLEREAIGSGASAHATGSMSLPRQAEHHSNGGPIYRISVDCILCQPTSMKRELITQSPASHHATIY